MLLFMYIYSSIRCFVYSFELKVLLRKTTKKMKDGNAHTFLV